MTIDDFLISGAVLQWSFHASGQPICSPDALAPSDPAGPAALARNAAVRAMTVDVEAYEAAQVALAADETDAGAAAIVSGASAATQALALWRAGEPDAWGETAEADVAAKAAHAAWVTARDAAADECDRLAGGPTLDLADAKASRKAALADRRWRAETGGSVISGLSVSTDAQSQAKLTAAAVAAMLDPAFSVQWKMASGDFATLNHDQVISLAQGARAHVQGCFDREAALAAQIDVAATFVDLLAIDIEAGWPANPA